MNVLFTTLVLTFTAVLFNGRLAGAGSSALVSGTITAEGEVSSHTCSLPALPLFIDWLCAYRHPYARAYAREAIICCCAIRAGVLVQLVKEESAAWRLRCQAGSLSPHAGERPGERTGCRDWTLSFSPSTTVSNPGTTSSHSSHRRSVLEEAGEDGTAAFDLERSGIMPGTALQVSGTVVEGGSVLHVHSITLLRKPSLRFMPQGQAAAAGRAWDARGEGEGAVLDDVVRGVGPGSEYRYLSHNPAMLTIILDMCGEGYTPAARKEVRAAVCGVWCLPAHGMLSD